MPETETPKSEVAILREALNRLVNPEPLDIDGRVLDPVWDRDAFQRMELARKALREGARVALLEAVTAGREGGNLYALKAALEAEGVHGRYFEGAVQRLLDSQQLLLGPEMELLLPPS